MKNRKKVKFPVEQWFSAGDPRPPLETHWAATLEGEAPGIQCVWGRAVASQPECRQQRPAHGIPTPHASTQHMASLLVPLPSMQPPPHASTQHVPHLPGASAR